MSARQMEAFPAVWCETHLSGGEKTETDRERKKLRKTKRKTGTARQKARVRFNERGKRLAKPKTD